MEAVDVLRRAHKGLSSTLTGQVPQVRTIMGRQVLLYHDTTKIFMLPYRESDTLQILDTLSAHFGEFWGLLDLDEMDTSWLP